MTTTFFNFPKSVSLESLTVGNSAIFTSGITVNNYPINFNNVSSGQFIQYNGNSFVTSNTLTATEINGATASSGSFDFSKSDGKFITPTGDSIFYGASNTFSGPIFAKSIKATSLLLDNSNMGISGKGDLIFSNDNNELARLTTSGQFITSGSIKTNGYILDLSGGFTDNQILTYNNTSIVPTTVKMYYSPIAQAQSRSSLMFARGNNTYGCAFQILQPMKFTGIRLLYPDNIERSFTISLWDPNGSRYLTQPATFNYPGIQTYKFSKSIPIESYKTWHIGMRGDWYIKYTANDVPSAPFMGGHNFVWCGFNLFSMDDAKPVVESTTEYYPIEPILE